MQTAADSEHGRAIRSTDESRSPPILRQHFHIFGEFVVSFTFSHQDVLTKSLILWRTRHENAIGHAILRYPAEATGYSQQHKRRSYPKTRTDFLPLAYVLLTRERVPGMKERHDQDHKEGSPCPACWRWTC
jgi:hypothetical protein